MIKRKRTKPQKQLLSSSLALTIAAAASSPSTSSSDHNSPSHLDICDRTSRHEVEQDMANCLILLAQGHHSQNSPMTNSYNDDTVIDLYMYQCKTCDRSFPSFQALGGHRASHKRPKAGCAETSSLYNDDTNTILSLQISSSSRSDHSSGVKIGKTKSSSKVHECSICGAEFTSGQALGGHMRRHRSSLPPRTSMPSSNHEPDESKKPSTNVFSLDLNLPAPSEDIDDQQQTDTKFPFTYNEQVIVFSPSALVDCHH